ncbi:MAG: hypothetical protein GYA50_02050 [Eubacteriaceae bacterium]|nr:hypothetical protein [Eubacteriaceae bacterium]
MDDSSSKENNPFDIQNDSNAVEDILLDTINKMRKDDPLIGAKLGAKEVINSLMSMMNDSNGIHIETFMCALGSLAGYSCQASLRKELIELKGLDEKQVFAVVFTNDGSKYFFGDLINKPLAEDEYSVWSLAAGAVQYLGINEIIDVEDIFKHVAETVGNHNYGIPRIPEGHEPMDMPYNFVKFLWPLFLPIAEKYCDAPNEWPIMFGLSVQEGIILGKDVLNPLLSLSLAMESAIPMAKVDIIELK